MNFDFDILAQNVINTAPFVFMAIVALPELLGGMFDMVKEAFFDK